VQYERDWHYSLRGRSRWVVRVGHSRVTLDTVVAAFNQGANPEQIARQYPSLALADIYAVIGYYLHRRQEVDEYLERRQEEALKVRQENEARWSPSGVREKLLARRNPPDAKTSG
jgi:uncharacterized protein (DUF433 family)